MKLDRAMLHSPVRNYVIPGLTSWLVGAPSPTGTVRLFECARDHQEVITPHSHRFDFRCLVLAGQVTNRVWRRDDRGDEFCCSTLRYQGAIGRYAPEPGPVERFVGEDLRYLPGDWYGMYAHQIHSIRFARGTEVLFFEGPKITDESFVLEPHVDGETLPTFVVEPWMFQGNEQIVWPSIK